MQQPHRSEIVYAEMYLSGGFEPWVQGASTFEKISSYFAIALNLPNSSRRCRDSPSLSTQMPI
jgi:hypothetical protein